MDFIAGKTGWCFSRNEKSVSCLIIGYAEKRAKKDKYNREKGVKRLQTAYKSGMITKEHVNRRGYNKFLELSDHVKETIHQEKIREDERWDGWKGYLTDTEPDAKRLRTILRFMGNRTGLPGYKEYAQNAPMFHFTQKRIEAHVCICFVAYKIYMELERFLKISGETLTKTRLLTPKHKVIEPLFDKNFWKLF